MTALYFGSFSLALLATFVLTKYVRDYALARGWVATPASGRHLHTSPIPRLGGVAIFLGFIITVAVASVLGTHSSVLSEKISLPKLATLLGPALIVFLLGVYDDLRGAAPWLKFTTQGIAATLLFFCGLGILDLPLLFGSRHFSWLVGLPLTIIWVLGITNAFNLIDGLDGLAAGSALFSTLVVFVVSLVSHSWLVALLTIALAGAILGFLRFNFNPATIFLGDCGSLFIGFLLSALSLESATKAPTIIAVAIPVVSFGLPILETAISILRRLISGRPVFTADREHIHHKLLERGLSHRQVVIVLYAVSALFGLLSLFLLWPTGSTLGLVLAVLGTGVWLGVQHLGYLEFGELRRVAQRTIEQPRIFVNNLAIRRAIAELRVARDYDQICRILVAAFETNDFDRFELQVHTYAGEFSSRSRPELFGEEGELFCSWNRASVPGPREIAPMWRLNLDLITSGNHNRGAMTISRSYTSRTLQLDINLLTSEFPGTLADALDRVLRLEAVPLAMTADGAFAATRPN